MVEPFHFFTRLTQTELLNKKAKNIVELLKGIKTVPGSSIYYHTHRFLQQHHFLSPEPPNDFAYWITNVLNEEALGEIILSIDIIQFGTIRELRLKLASVIENYLKGESSVTNCHKEEEFHFMACRLFVLQTPYVATNIVEFRSALKKISIDSLYFHIFESRLRLEKGENDFSHWLKELGEAKIAERISQIDPYTYTLEGLKKEILSLIRK